MGASNVVNIPWKGPKVKDRKDGHFNAKEEGRDANFNVWRHESFTGLDDSGRCKKRDQELKSALESGS